MNFGQLVFQATGFRPYAYQERLAIEGLPTLLVAPTGSGKSVAAVLPWLHRRRFHPDEGIRASTPRWLIIALPLRTLVDQLESQIENWLSNLGLTDEVGLHVLMGGRDGATSWTNRPTQDAILIGSIDMLLSRALNRGYASNRYHWPIDFGMVNSGAQWVFDEVQLMGPAVPTSRQLQAFRASFGTVLPTSSMWMSATVAPDWLATVDAPDVESSVEIGPEDRAGPLGDVMSATRRLAELPDLDPRKPRSIADAVVAEHRAGTRTICMLNTVKAAQALYKQLLKQAEADVVLVHSRFRPLDRARATGVAVAADLPDAGRIVVTTQAFEAGVDVSSETLITEAAPWTSIVQRAGRCNRYGETSDARLFWYEPSSAAPYDDTALKQAVETLRTLEGQAVTGESLANEVFEAQPFHPVIRRRDLVDLFDTTPTLTGEDIDISPYIRGGEDRDLFVGWREIDTDPADAEKLGPDELCRVSVSEARTWIQDLAKRGPALVWRYDPERGEWSRVGPGDLRPGVTLLASSRAGAYNPETGWDRSAKSPVVPIEPPTSPLDVATDSAAGDDELSLIGSWVSLPVHLGDTKDQAERLLVDFAADVPAAVRDAVIAAAALHDIGKVHPVFQRTLRDSAGDGERPLPRMTWAKSSRQKRVRHERPHFRHELVSALMLLSPSASSVLPEEADLTRYLVAAHHGRVRLGIRSLEKDRDPDGADRVIALGVIDGEEVPACELHDGTEVPATEMPVATAIALGGEGSWTRAALALRDRVDLGPFRLAWLEAVVRLADWLASANPSSTVTVPTTDIQADEGGRH